MEQTETETRQRLNNKIERLEAELASLKCRMEEEVAQRHNLGQVMDVCNVHSFHSFVFVLYMLLYVVRHSM